MHSADTELEEFLDLLYQAPASGDWYLVAEVLGNVVGRRHVTLVRREARTGLGLRAQTGFRYGDFEHIRDRFVADANAYVEALAAQPERRADPTQAAPPETHGYLSLDGHLRRSFGVTPEFGAILHARTDCVQFLSIMRPVDDRSDDAEGRKRFLTVLPHLRRAMAVAIAFEHRAPQAWGFEAVFEALAAAAFLCDADGRVREANDPARDLAARGDGLRTAGGALSFLDPVAGRRARVEIDRASARAPGHRARFSARRGAGALPLSVTVSGHARGVAVVLVEDPERDMAPGVEALAALAGLSPAQARAAQLAAAGLGTRALAEAMGVSENTVRTHLRRAFDKLDVRDRRELALRLAALRGVFR
ncbi:helix-turn-helix transcriptional regulator [Rubrimonas cliftonensis]|uniref:Regulatory protein, luxR family n=1 Tax=Rubrimonas cliftonensis TaxID=89524 RepID=A0A1H4G4H5_9RHOB|nr:helix-turn-helix transcriptional regulator [Rubrimonas cliftonensis]SEB04211.1 regulatory protein, luxR family [Rubrimonas cliftonensis]